MIDYSKIISWNCTALSVPLPTIRIVEPSELATNTVTCAVSNDGRELLINKQFAESKDIFFAWLALSHECRHIWQAKNMPELFNDYKTSAYTNLQEYNAQPAEVDAWAWAVAVLGEKFGVRPTLEKNFGAELWAQIQSRARQISDKMLY